jgi:hypothetical protein
MDYYTPTLVRLGNVKQVVLGTEPVDPNDNPDNGLGMPHDINAGLDE